MRPSHPSRSWITPQVISELQNEIRRTELLRYAHRLHGVLLVAQGISYPKAAALLSESERTLVYWVRRYRSDGLAGLHERERSGRPQRLTTAQLKKIASVLFEPPERSGSVTPRWSGRTLAEWIKENFAIELSAAQARRILRKFRAPHGQDKPKAPPGEAGSQGQLR